MKFNQDLLLLLLFFFSCSTGIGTNDQVKGNQLDDAEEIHPGRKQLIEELRLLGKTLSSGNKKKIAGLFPFPLTDTVINIYVEDDEFNSQFEKNGDQITQEMFLDYFRKISPQLMLNDFSRLFEELNLDSLRYVNILEKELIEPAEPCYRRYMITIEGDEVALQFGTNSNTNYQAAAADTSEGIEEAGAACEFTSIWIFEYRHNKLQLVRQAIAG